MEYCGKNNTCVTNLRLTMGDKTVTCQPNAKGYWQAHGMPTVQGVECDEELHKWRGIGWVEDDNVQIIWSARHPVTKDIAFWRDIRSAKNQAQIIWSAPQMKIEIELPENAEDVRGVKEYTSLIK